MLKALLGNTTKERILLSIMSLKEVYPRELAARFNISVSVLQKQFDALEKGGVVSSKLKGKTRLYSFNPRYPFLKELINLLEKVLSFIPKDEQDKYYSMRLRPRRAGKPL